MKKTRMIISLLLVCLMVLSLAACGNGSKKDKADDGSEDKALHVAVAGDPGSLLPLAASGAGGFLSVARSNYDCPWNTRRDGTLEFMLVESFDTVSDIEYTFHLRKGVTFSNGNPYTADDFMFSMELCRNHPQHYLNVAAIDFDKTNIVDDNTIDLWLTHYDVSQWAGMAIMYIYDKESYDEDYLALHTVGTGPYIVTDYVPNSHVTCEAREDYWAGTPKIKTVVFDVKAEDSQKVNALVTGDVHYASVPIQEVEYVKSLGTYDVNLLSSAAAECAFFNCSPDGVLGSLDARMAVMYAIDRQKISNLVYGGLVENPSWPTSNYAFGYDAALHGNMEVYKHGHDIDLAKEYAEKAGLVGKEVRIATNGSTTYNTMAEIIQEDLAKIGVEGKIMQYDSGTYTATLMDASMFDIGLLYVGSPSKNGADMINGYISFLPLGWTGPERDQIMDLLTKAVGTADEAASKDYLAQAMQVWDTVHPWFSLVEMVDPAAISKDISNYEPYADACVHVANWSWK